MKINLRSIYCVFLTLFFVNNLCSAQPFHQKCCGVNFSITLLNDSLEKLNNEPIVITQHIIDPIVKSHSLLEIRQYVITGGYSEVIVIKCDGKIFSGVLYDQILSTKSSNKLELGTSYKNAGQYIGGDAGVEVLFRSAQLNALKTLENFRTFIVDLKGNNFFTLPSGTALDEICGLKSGANFINANTVIYEYKVGEHVGRVVYMRSYQRWQSKIKSCDDILKIDQQFHNLLK